MKTYWSFEGSGHPAPTDLDLPVKFDGGSEIVSYAYWNRRETHGDVVVPGEKAFVTVHYAVPDFMKLSEFLELFEDVEHVVSSSFDTYHTNMFDALLVITTDEFAQVRLVRGQYEGL